MEFMMDLEANLPPLTADYRYAKRFIRYASSKEETITTMLLIEVFFVLRIFASQSVGYLLKLDLHRRFTTKLAARYFPEGSEQRSTLTSLVDWADQKYSPSLVNLLRLESLLKRVEECKADNFVELMNIERLKKSVKGNNVTLLGLVTDSQQLYISELDRLVELIEKAIVVVNNLWVAIKQGQSRNYKHTELADSIVKPLLLNLLSKIAEKVRANHPVGLQELPDTIRAVFGSQTAT